MFDFSTFTYRFYSQTVPVLSFFSVPDIVCVAVLFLSGALNQSLYLYLYLYSMVGGRLFHTLATATGKAQSPMVLCFDRGTCSNAVDADRNRLPD